MEDKVLIEAATNAIKSEQNIATKMLLTYLLERLRELTGE
jgi:hypothetical protein